MKRRVTVIINRDAKRLSGYSEMAFLVWCLISGCCKVGNVHAKITLQEMAGQSICDWSLSNTITHTRHLSI